MGWSFPPATCATRSASALPHRVPRTGVSAARAYHVERLLSWAFPGEVAEEEDRGPVVPLPGTTHGMKRGGVIFRAPTETQEERERQAIELAKAKRHRYEAAEASPRRAGPSTCGDPECDYCQGYVEDSIITPSDPYEVRKIVVPKGRTLSDAAGKRSTSRTKSARGRYVRSVPWEKGGTSPSTPPCSPPPPVGTSTGGRIGSGSGCPTCEGSSGNERWGTSSSW